ncbi:MAG: hypothetical protein FD136_632 [Chitinophagaceae bacterium]|nr:MAG: hypothetical protein FD136_632 [Chitinophagaceae bacterium]
MRLIEATGNIHQEDQCNNRKIDSIGIDKVTTVTLAIF